MRLGKSPKLESTLFRHALLCVYEYGFHRLLSAMHFELSAFYPDCPDRDSALNLIEQLESIIPYLGERNDEN